MTIWVVEVECVGSRIHMWVPVSTTYYLTKTAAKKVLRQMEIKHGIKAFRVSKYQRVEKQP